MSARKKDSFSDLIALGHILCQMADLLCTPQQRFESIFDKAKDLEQSALQWSSHLQETLKKEFLPILDREDMILLSQDILQTICAQTDFLAHCRSIPSIHDSASLYTLTECLRQKAQMLAAITEQMRGRPSGKATAYEPEAKIQQNLKATNRSIRDLCLAARRMDVRLLQSSLPKDRLQFAGHALVWQEANRLADRFARYESDMIYVLEKNGK